MAAVPIDASVRVARRPADRSAAGPTRASAVGGLALLVGLAVGLDGCRRSAEAAGPTTATTPAAQTDAAPLTGDAVDAALAAAGAARDARAADLDARAEALSKAALVPMHHREAIRDRRRELSQAVFKAMDARAWPTPVFGKDRSSADCGELESTLIHAEQADSEVLDHGQAVYDKMNEAVTALKGESADIAKLRAQLAANPSAADRAAIVAKSAAYRDGTAKMPDAAAFAVDPYDPPDIDALLQ